jgi:YidC/Oxa1 family membrane protein insertase
MKAWLLVQKSSKIDKICRRNKILTSPGIFRSCSTNSNGITDPKDIEALNGVIETTYSSISELSYVNPKNAVIRAIAGIHDFTDLPYWQTIICFTLSLRVLLLPIAIRSMQNAARMAVMRPELEKVQNEFKAKADYLDEKQQLIFQQQVKALFLKHRVNPIRAVLLPLFQLPIFISVFTALNNINAYLPGYVNGGDFWFVNLAAPDTYYIFPIVNALSFLMMVEMGADGMAMNQKKTFQWAMRGLSVVMIPLTMSVSQVGALVL